MTIRQFSQRPEPIYHNSLDVDANGFVYVYGLKVARYNQMAQTLEFIDHRRTRQQSSRVVEVRADQLGIELLRLTKGQK